MLAVSLSVFKTFLPFGGYQGATPSCGQESSSGPMAKLMGNKGKKFRVVTSSRFPFEFDEHWNGEKIRQPETSSTPTISLHHGRTPIDTFAKAGPWEKVLVEKNTFLHLVDENDSGSGLRRPRSNSLPATFRCGSESMVAYDETPAKCAMKLFTQLQCSQALHQCSDSAAIKEAAVYVHAIYSGNGIQGFTQRNAVRQNREVAKVEGAIYPLRRFDFEQFAPLPPSHTKEWPLKTARQVQKALHCFPPVKSGKRARRTARARKGQNLPPIQVPSRVWQTPKTGRSSSVIRQTMPKSEGYKEETVFVPLMQWVGEDTSKYVKMLPSMLTDFTGCGQWFLSQKEVNKLMHIKNGNTSAVEGFCSITQELGELLDESLQEENVLPLSQGTEPVAVLEALPSQPLEESAQFASLRKRRKQKGASDSDATFKEMHRLQRACSSASLLDVPEAPPQEVITIIGQTRRLREQVLTRVQGWTEQLIRVCVAALMVYRTRITDLREHGFFVKRLQNE